MTKDLNCNREEAAAVILLRVKALRDALFAISPDANAKQIEVDDKLMKRWKECSMSLDAALSAYQELHEAHLKSRPWPPPSGDQI